MARLGLLSATLLMALVVGSAARAQVAPVSDVSPNPPSDADTLSEQELAEARAHHLGAVDALQANDLVAAEQGFRAALAITFRASTAYNLALVLSDTRRPMEAIALYDQVLALADDALPRLREEIAQDRQRALARRATLEVSVQGVARAEVSVDGNSAGTVGAGISLSVPVDPGEHRVVARDDERHLDASARLGEGETRQVRLEFPIVTVPTPSDVAVQDQERAEEEEEDERMAPAPSRAPYYLAAAAVVVVVAAVVLAIVLVPDGDEGFTEAPIPNFGALRAR